VFTEWIRTTTKNGDSDPPSPDTFELALRTNAKQYNEFADRMIRAVYGKSRYADDLEKKEFDALISKSQEAFTLLLYRNGYESWLWMHNDPGTSTSEDTFDGAGDECPPYKYTARSNEMTSRNGGWSRAGMLNYNALYLKVKENRENNKGAFEKDYKEHWKEIYSPNNKRKRSSGGRFQILTVSDDLGELLTAANSPSDAVVPV
jgi:hypothetical protein